jgi:S1-C subfamily serine protease
MSGDIVKAVDGQPVIKGIDVYKRMADKQPGDTLRVQVERSGSIVDTTIILSSRN